MAKKAIHLTENELKQMIYEEVKEAFDKSKPSLKDAMGMYGVPQT